MSAAPLHDCLRRFPGAALEVAVDGVVRASNGHLDALVGRGVAGERFAGLLDDSSQGKWRRIQAARHDGISACTWELVFTTPVTLELRKFLAVWGTGGDEPVLWLLEFSVDTSIEKLYSELSDLHGELVEAQRTLGREKNRLAHALEEAEQAVRTRDELMAVVSHDLRNPLNTIVMAAGALELDLPPSARAEQVSIIKRASENMTRLIADLLDVSAIESGRFRVDPEVVELEELLQEAVALLGGHARQKGVRLTCEVASGVPPARADRHRLMQVLGNLVGNAVKFTPRHGRITVSAQAGQARTEGMVVVSVTDTGPGIEPAHLPHIFDRFWHTRSKRGGGAGLGLAISRGIVEAHGGALWASSEPGAGACFQFTLPVAAG